MPERTSIVKTESPRRPRMIVLGYGAAEVVAREFERLKPRIEKHAEIALVDLGEYRDLSGTAADFAIVLGGDGAILRGRIKWRIVNCPCWE